MLKLLLAYSRVGIPLLLGVCIGVALSFIILPFLEEQNCAWNHNSPVLQSRRERSNLIYHERFSDNIDWESFRRAEYEPHLIESSQSESQTAKKPARHRFLRSELNIKDTLFIGYLSGAEELHQRTLALNLSVTRPQDDPQSLKFFVDSSHSALPKTVDRQFPSLVSLNLLDSNSLPLLTIKYISTHTYRHNRYKYYMFVSDSVYVQTSMITKLLQRLDNEEFLGFPSASEGDACDLTIGFILSHEALSKVAENVGRCEQMFKSIKDSHEAIGKCIKMTLSPGCTTVPAGVPLIKHEFSEDKVTLSEVLQKSHVISGIKSSKEVFTIRRLLADAELRRTKEKINKLKQKTAQLLTNNNGDLSWPLAVSKPFQTSNRFDVIRWTYIRGNTSYLEYDHVNSQLLQGHNLGLHKHMVQDALAFLNRKEEDRYSLNEIVHGYKSMDPSRGLGYKLSLSVHDRLLNKDETKCVELLKPLTTFQMMPTVSSKDLTPVYIIVPLYGTSDVTSLLKNFGKIYLKDPHVHLQVLLIYSMEEFAAYQRGADDTFNDVKAAITESEAKAANGHMAKWKIVASENLSLVKIVADAISALRPNCIVFTSTADTQITTSFISRVRANTVRGHKIYAPMAFWQYDLDLIMANTKNSNKLDVARANGHFGEKWFDHLAFFADDFLKPWSNAAGTFNDIYSVLLSSTHMSILRVPDPDCVVKHGYQSCSRMMAFDKNLCNAQRIDNVGSGPLLAMKLLKNGTVKGRIDQ